MDTIVIIGSSGQAKVIIDTVEQQGVYNIAGLLDPERRVGEKTLEYEILGKEEDLPKLVDAHRIVGAIVAVGDNFLRSTIATRVMTLCPDLPFVCAIHPKSSLANDVRIGDGTVIMAGVAVNSSSSVGRFCILNTNSSLDHDSVMEDFSSFAPGATSGGNCRVGQFSAVGIGAVLVHGVHVGEHTVIGAGSTVLGNIESNSVAFGTPAKVVRERNPGDNYL